MVRALVFGILDEYGLKPDVEGTDIDLFDIEAHYLNRGGVFEVLETETGEIVGTVGLFPIDDKTVELRKMYFAPSIRGRGLGKATLGRMVQTAAKLGFATITLETASVLKEAIGLYTKFGFEPADDLHSPRCDRAFSLKLTNESSEI